MRNRMRFTAFFKGGNIMHRLTLLLLATAIFVGTAVPVRAQQPPAPPPPPTTPYGSPIGLDAAKKVMTAAEAEATKNNWPMAIVILDSSGHTVMLHKLDNTQYGSIRVAEDKAQTAPDFRRWQDHWRHWSFRRSFLSGWAGRQGRR